MSVNVVFNNLEHLTLIIDALKQVGSQIQYSVEYDQYNQILIGYFDKLLFKDQHPDIKYAKIIVDDMFSMKKIEDLSIGLFELMKDYINRLDAEVCSYIIDKIFQNKKKFIFFNELWLDQDKYTFKLYLLTNNKYLENFIIKNLAKLSITRQYDFLKPGIMDKLIKQVGRDKFWESIKDLDEEDKTLYLQAYDAAVDRRIVDVSLGLGYQNIPTFVLEEIVKQDVDTSGMTAYQLNEIVYRINEWKTPVSMRAGAHEDYEPEFQDF